jgi:Uma2 family endonuclease
MHAESAALRREELLDRWNELAADPESPDRYELNELGELILSPKPTNDHQRVAFAVARALEAQLGPEAGFEISVYTDRGIRVPDVIWMPAERWRDVKGKSPFPFVPDVCVEVLSPGNSRAQITMKTGAYLRGGAREVIVVGLKGEIRFFGAEGTREASALGLRFQLPPELF